MTVRLLMSGMLLFGSLTISACNTFAPGKQETTAGTQIIPQTNLKPDEHVLLFPTNAHYDHSAHQWIIPVHGWVFEPEKTSVWRKGLIKSLEKFIGVKKNTEASRLFENRTQMFLVDNESDKNIVLNINGQHFRAPTTGANGHFSFTARVNGKSATCSDQMLIKVVTPASDHRTFSGTSQCVHDNGISVISDIDDTIKDSNVLSKRELLKNTFMHNFKSVQSMADIYQYWSHKGYRFHYVSASPWQLYPALSQFLKEKKFPFGSMHLKLVRLKDKSFFNLFDSPEEGKIPTITKLLKNHPQRKFILVGDSGEKDPDIYASIARKYPDRIVKIFIRDVRHDLPRLTTIFSGLDKNKWFVFTNAKEILNKPAVLAVN